MPENDPTRHMTGLLLANLGTPTAPERKPVARFLREFLSDPRVVDLPRFLWLPLLYCVIVPLRAGRSAEAYRKVWWDEGSPLLVLTERLASQMQKLAADSTVVEIGMRYGEPSILNGLRKLRDAGVDRVTVLPLYPQFSGTTTASIYDAVDAALEELSWQPLVQRIQDYYQHPDWIEAVAGTIQAFQTTREKPDRLLFSLHGIPQRYVANGDPYQAHCEGSVEAITTAIGLSPDDWVLTYQSRVGREPWLQPYTDLTLEEMAKSGVKRVQVVCPGFAVDCLETLEEIAMQNEELFIEAGGDELEYIPALNDSETHARALLSLINP